MTTFHYEDPVRGDHIPTRRNDPLVGDTLFAYDAFNRRIGVTDPNGVLTETRYDDLDRVTFVIQRSDDTAQPGDPIVADDLVTERIYGPLGDLDQTVLSEGNVLGQEYDTAGRLTSVERNPDTVSKGERTRYELDGAGNRIREELQVWDEAAGDWAAPAAVTEFGYRSRCQLETVTRAPGPPEMTVTEFAYDCNGNLEKVWDANHPSAGQTAPPTQTYAYDELDRLVSITEPWEPGDDAVTSYGYDVQDHLTSVTDAEGNVTNYRYSDRDLLDEQTSPVSGTTRFTYNKHGELDSETDARGVTVQHTVDELDRVQAVAYPDASLDVTYTYGDDPGAPAVPFSIGRLIEVERDNETVDYTYDRYGRLLQDGGLTYEYDENGNRTRTTHPQGPDAVATFDFADRPETLTLVAGAFSRTLVSQALYEPVGPLAELSLGNGLTELRGFDQRYVPASITVGSLLDWTYGTDAVGNVESITDGLGTADRSFGYRDVQYFLTCAAGPWSPAGADCTPPIAGEPLEWTYDEIGNRLTAERDGVTDTYDYGGHTPQLQSITFGDGSGTDTYAYDAAGDLTGNTGTRTLSFAYDDAGRLAAIDPGVSPPSTTLSYDGRSFLERSLFQASPTQAAATDPTYSSDGRLHHFRRTTTGGTPRHHYVFYFGDRPVAILTADESGGGLASPVLTYLTTDHLGTPVLATDPAGVEVWSGGFEPFGEDYAGAQAAGVFLRLPGQWEDLTWENGNLASGLYDNVHRWYSPAIGSYTKPDPLGLVNPNTFSPSSALGSSIEMVYSYAEMNPLLRIDPLGQRSRVCCRRIPRLGLFRHCAIQIERDGNTTTCGLFGGRFTPGEEPGTGQVRPDHPFDRPGTPDTDCGPWNESCEVDQCVIDTANSYANPSKYRVVRAEAPTATPSQERSLGSVG